MTQQLSPTFLVVTVFDLRKPAALHPLFIYIYVGVCDVRQRVHYIKSLVGSKFSASKFRLIHYG